MSRWLEKTHSVMNTVAAPVEDREGFLLLDRLEMQAALAEADVLKNPSYAFDASLPS